MIAGTVKCTIQHYHVNICGVHPTIAVCITPVICRSFVGGCGWVVVQVNYDEVVVLVVVEVVVVDAVLCL